MINKRVIRISLGLIILFVLIISIVPYFYKYSSVDAVISARTTTLHSPIEGILHYDHDTKFGTYFKKGEIIGKVLNDRVEERFLYELNTERKTLESRITSLDDRLLKFNKLSDSLKVQLENYKKYSENQINIQILQENEILEQEKAENERAKKELDSSQGLSTKQIITQRLLETHQANYNKSKDRIEEIEQRIDELKNTLLAVQSGIFLGIGGGNNDSPYSKQRMDQLVIEISLAQTAANEAKFRLEGITAQIEKEKDRLIKAKCFDILSPFDALVWRKVQTEGSTIVIGSEIIVLLECNSIFIDATVSESEFSNINPGDKIQYKLISETVYHTGTVYGLRGSGSITTDLNLAAAIIKDPKKECQILIKPDPADLNLTPENFYQIGHRVEVRIVRKWQPLKALARFWGIF